MPAVPYTSGFLFRIAVFFIIIIIIIEVLFENNVIHLIYTRLPFTLYLLNYTTYFHFVLQSVGSEGVDSRELWIAYKCLSLQSLL